MTNDWPAIFG